MAMGRLIGVVVILVAAAVLADQVPPEMHGPGAVTWEAVAVLLLIPALGTLIGMLWWSQKTASNAAADAIKALDADQGRQNERLARLEARFEGNTADLRRIESKMDGWGGKIDQLTAAIFEQGRTIHGRIDSALLEAMKKKSEVPE